MLPMPVLRICTKIFSGPMNRLVHNENEGKSYSPYILLNEIHTQAGGGGGGVQLRI